MKRFFSIFVIILSTFSLNAQDSLQKDSIFLPANKKIIQVRFGFNLLRNYPEISIVRHYKKINIIFGANFSHPKIYKKDSTYSNLPYAISDSSVHYEVRSFTNQKFDIFLGLEYKFKPSKNLAQFIIGCKLSLGKYNFQDYYADTYYNYYKDSLTNQVYYYDRYGDPSWEAADAFTYVRAYAKNKSEFISFNFDSYIGFNHELPNKIFSYNWTIGMKYENFHSLKIDRYDFLNRLNSPTDDFNLFRFYMKISFIFKLTS